MKTFIRVNGVTKTFSLAAREKRSTSPLGAVRNKIPFINRHTIRAIDSISFEVREGERVGIIGRNGAGKTSLLSMLAGISKPSSGEIDVVGDVHAMLTIGAVLRDDATGRENIVLDGAVHGRSHQLIEAHAAEIAEFSELGEFIDRPVRTYSSGMKARLAFAMGVFVDPDILIIDETLSVGDAFFAVKARKKIRELTDSGRIVLMVSHGLDAIVQMCSRCLWLDGGRLVMDGEPQAVTAAYQAAIQQSDERSLRQKFPPLSPVALRKDLGEIDGLGLVQDGVDLSASAQCLVPLAIHINVHLKNAISRAEIEVAVTRVDGHLVWRQSVDLCALRGRAGRFRVSIEMNPFLLGANLYRIDADLRSEDILIARASRVLEAVDGEGQYGGVPMLLCPPLIISRKVDPSP